MDLRADAIAALKAQFAEAGRWEVTSVDDQQHEEPGDGPFAPPTVTRTVTLLVEEANPPEGHPPGKALVFMLEGAETPTSGTMNFNGSSYKFSDPQLIAVLMTAVTPEAQDVYHDELIAYLTAPLETV